jgi:hypothetical protein
VQEALWELGRGHGLAVEFNHDAPWRQLMFQEEGFYGTGEIHRGLLAIGSDGSEFHSGAQFILKPCDVSTATAVKIRAQNEGVQAANQAKKSHKTLFERFLQF